MNATKLKNKLFLILFCLSFPFCLSAQNIKISGNVLDAQTNTPIAGATITVNGIAKGSVTDVDGRFLIQAEAGKKYTLKISYVGYKQKEVTDVAPDENAVTILLENATANLQEVVIAGISSRRETVSSLYVVQKNSSAISDGISSEIIKKSPDKNAGEVLKRVSGASVQDNKFVVIRGLSERYNTALLNNSVLPSTELDKKAFAFDIIPSSLIENVVIYKSPTPDLPGDFSGGAVKISTKEYPSRQINELSLSIGYNSRTTGKDFYNGLPAGNLDWLGYFDNSRLIPRAYYQHRTDLINLSDANKKFITKQFPDTYGYTSANKSLPNFSVAYTGGNTKFLKGSSKLGYLYSVIYGEGRKVSGNERNEYETYGVPEYFYNTNNYESTSNLSALLNLTYSYSKSKISLKTLYNNNFEKSVGIRSGSNVINGESDKFFIKSNNTEAAGNGIFNSVVEGAHRPGKNTIINWNASYGLTYKWEPDQKTLAFHTQPGSDVYNLTLSNENSPEISNAGRVYSFLYENIYGANIDATKEFRWLGNTQKLKIGTSNYYRDRNVEVDALGYSILNSAGFRVTIPETKSTTFNNIFSPGNIDAYNLTVSNIPTNSAAYAGTALMNAGYAMLDNKFSKKIKLTWGVRVENYAQEIKAKNKNENKHSNFDVLPSVLFTYSLNSKTNLRLAGSQSVNRPEFRELADYRVYDYNNEVNLIGNPMLGRSKNTNADLRYEWFPALGEIISASLFYKYFDKPIEQVNLGNNILSWENADNAIAYGIEAELRKKLSSRETGFFSHFTFYANAAYIKGSVKFANITTNSPLQGQSPYVVNGGLTYQNNNDFSINLLYNRIGPRLKFRAINGSGRNIFEKPRDVVDFQIGKKLMNKKMDVRLTVNDILASAFVWYYKYETDPKKTNYNPSTDRIMLETNYGTTAGLSVKYSF